MLRQRSDRRFCTVAYVYLERVDGGARVGFASGGHPLPLLLHADGAVEKTAIENKVAQKSQRRLQEQPPPTRLASGRVPLLGLHARLVAELRGLAP